jgi:hypothetical protein
VNNRGNKRALIQFNSAAPGNEPTSPQHAGNGFLMRQGFSVVWSGWIPGLPATNNALRIDVPAAIAGPTPIKQVVWDEFLFNTNDATKAALTFPAANTDKGTAKLLVRERNDDPGTPVPAEQWEFVGNSAVRLLPAGTPFKIGAIYQLTYEAADPRVSGIAFAATRDLIAFLRHELADEAGTPNPLATAGRVPINRALAHGTSQSGRFLRDFVYRGFNEDEANRIVFEGMNPHIGTSRVFLNHRFAQPNRMTPIGHGFMFFPDTSFPFAYETQADPFSGTRDGILARCSERGNCPKIIHTTSATEYWQSGASLITTDPAGERDGTPPENVRIYHFASTQHVGGATMPKGVCALPPNPVDYRPLLRGVAFALDRWVKDGARPPASRYPRLADGTLVDAEEFSLKLPGMSGPVAPAPRPRFDYGTDFARGILAAGLPKPLPDSYRVRVPKVDADGNEIAGVRLAEVTVPLGTATGWAVRAQDAGAAGALCYLDGSFVPFGKSRAEREANNDARLSLAERYGSKEEYAGKVREAAVALQKDGYILEEDVDRAVAKANAVQW